MRPIKDIKVLIILCIIMAFTAAVVSREPGEKEPKPGKIIAVADTLAADSLIIKVDSL